jgi:hypothetical protein
VDDLELVFDGGFDRASLDLDRWLPAHLPQWSSRAQAAARHELRDGHLVLRIDRDQPPWCPEFDGPTRVSSLQTGVRSGPVGSTDGQHRFRPDVVVREAQAPWSSCTPHLGRIEVRLRACPDPRTMVALWMIGLEDVPERSGELCVCEIFGRDVGPGRARVGVGVHPFGDPDLVDDFEAVDVEGDATRPHTYAVDWRVDGATFTVDGEVVRRVAVVPDYPLQLMLGIYEFDQDGTGPSGRYPKELVVEHVRVWRERR